MAKLRVLSIFSLLIFVSCIVHAQEKTDPISWFHPNQEIHVNDLPNLAGPSTETSAILTTALETILHDKTICCAKGSAFENAVSPGPQSLKDISAALEDGHFWSDHPLRIHSDYVAQGTIAPGVILAALLGQHAAIIEWKSHFYVVCGAVFDETLHYSGRRQYAIHKFLLLDPRFYDQRRMVEFNRDTDDWGKVQEALTLTVQ